MAVAQDASRELPVDQPKALRLTERSRHNFCRKQLETLALDKLFKPSRMSFSERRPFMLLKSSDLRIRLLF